MRIFEKLGWYFLGLLFILTLYICFYKLGAAYLDDWDEAWYGEMAKQIIKTGEFIVLRWNGEYLFDKPPLYIWITTLFALLFGLTEFSIRLTSAISGLIIISLATWYIYKKWGLLPSIVGYCSLAFNDIFIWRVRSGNLDALVTLFIFLSFFVMISQWKYKYFALGFLFVCIFLTKTSLVFFPLSVFTIHELIYNYKNILKNLSGYFILLLIFVILVGSWLLLGKQKAGQEFFTYYLFRSDQGVTDIDFSKFKWEYLKYTYYSLQRRFLFVMFLGTAAAVFLKWKKGSYFLMIVFSYALIFLLSFTMRNNNWYLMPSMPFWSLLIGYGTYFFINTVKRLKTPFSIAVLLLTIYVSYKTFIGHIIPIMYTSSSTKQTQTALKAKSLSKPDETLVRMDHLYPSTIYYSDRHVLSSPSSTDGVLFISRVNVAKRIDQGKLQWLLGKKGDVESFVKEYNVSGKYIDVNDEEIIFQAKKNNYL